MPLKSAVIFEAIGGDRARDRVTIGVGQRSLTVVAIGEAGERLDAALELAASGHALIELCGGISPIARAEVRRAVGPEVRVSSVTYGIESLAAAARYSEAYERGEATKEAFLLLTPDAGQREPFLFGGPEPRTELVPVRDRRVAVESALRLIEDGTQLIELYGGFDTDAIAAILKAVDGRAAVGAGSFAIDEFGR